MRKILVLLALTLTVGGATMAQEAGERPFLGITFSATDGGALVREVLVDSPAAAAGLQVDDLILAVNGVDVAPAELAETITALAVGEELSLTILRADTRMELTATPGSAPTRRGQWQAFRDQAFLGVSLVTDEAGVLVEEVLPESPAATAGLQAGDLLGSINDEAIATPLEAAALIRALEPGATLTLGIERDGEALTLEAQAGSRLGNPEDMRRQLEKSFLFQPDAGQPLLGVEYLDLNADSAAERELTLDTGALILNVLPDTPAEAAGLLAQDIIVGVAGDPVDARRTLRERLLAYDPGETLQLELQRAGETLQLEVTLAENAGRLPFRLQGGRLPQGGGAELETWLERFGMELDPEALMERFGRGLDLEAWLEQFETAPPEAVAPAPDV